MLALRIGDRGAPDDLLAVELEESAGRRGDFRQSSGRCLPGILDELGARLDSLTVLDRAV
jgi:hypothetical protein